MTRQATTNDLGRIVRYYSNGWRFGRLAKIDGQQATIQPPRTGAHSVRVPLSDVEAVEEQRQEPAAAVTVTVPSPEFTGFLFGFEV